MVYVKITLLIPIPLFLPLDEQTLVFGAVFKGARQVRAAGDGGGEALNHLHKQHLHARAVPVGYILGRQRGDLSEAVNRGSSGGAFVWVRVRVRVCCS